MVTLHKKTLFYTSDLRRRRHPLVITSNKLQSPSAHPSVAAQAMNVDGMLVSADALRKGQPFGGGDPPVAPNIVVGVMGEAIAHRDQAIANRNQALAMMQRACEVRDGQVAQLRHSLRVAHATVVQLQGALQSQAAQMHAVVGKDAAREGRVRRQVNEMRTELKAANDGNQVLSAQLEELRRAHKDLSEAYDAAQKQLRHSSDLQSQLAAMTHERDRATQAVQQHAQRQTQKLRQNQTPLKSQLRKLRQSLAKLQEERDEALISFSKLKAEHERRQSPDSTVARMKVKMCKLHRHVIRLQDERDHALLAVSTLQAQLESLRDPQRPSDHTLRTLSKKQLSSLTSKHAANVAFHNSLAMWSTTLGSSYVAKALSTVMASQLPHYMPDNPTLADTYKSWWERLQVLDSPKEGIVALQLGDGPWLEQDDKGVRVAEMMQYLSDECSRKFTTPTMASVQLHHTINIMLEDMSSEVAQTAREHKTRVLLRHYVRVTIVSTIAFASHNALRNGAPCFVKQKMMTLLALERLPHDIDCFLNADTPYHATNLQKRAPLMVFATRLALCWMTAYGPSASDEVESELVRTMLQRHAGQLHRVLPSNDWMCSDSAMERLFRMAERAMVVGHNSRPQQSSSFPNVLLATKKLRAHHRMQRMLRAEDVPIVRLRASVKCLLQSVKEWDCDMCLSELPTFAEMQSECTSMTTLEAIRRFLQGVLHKACSECRDRACHHGFEGALTEPVEAAPHEDNIPLQFLQDWLVNGNMFSCTMGVLFQIPPVLKPIQRELQYLNNVYHASLSAAAESKTFTVYDIVNLNKIFVGKPKQHTNMALINCLQVCAGTVGALIVMANSPDFADLTTQVQLAMDNGVRRLLKQKDLVAKEHMRMCGSC